MKKLRKPRFETILGTIVFSIVVLLLVFLFTTDGGPTLSLSEKKLRWVLWILLGIVFIATVWTLLSRKIFPSLKGKKVDWKKLGGKTLKVFKGILNSAWGLVGLLFCILIVVTTWSSVRHENREDRLVEAKLNQPAASGPSEPLNASFQEGDHVFKLGVDEWFERGNDLYSLTLVPGTNSEGAEFDVINTKTDMVVFRIKFKGGAMVVFDRNEYDITDMENNCIHILRLTSIPRAVVHVSVKRK